MGPCGARRDAAACQPRGSRARTRQARLPLPSALSPRPPGQSRGLSARGRPPLRWHFVTAAAMREPWRVCLSFSLLFLLLIRDEASDMAGLTVQDEAGTKLSLTGCARAGHSWRDRVASVRGVKLPPTCQPPPAPCCRGDPEDGMPSSRSRHRRARAGQMRDGAREPQESG